MAASEDHPPPLLPPDQSGQNEAATTHVEECNVDAYTAFALEDGWTQPRHGQYESPLRYLMAFVHGRTFTVYPKGTTFARVQIVQLQPQHIHDWLAYKAFRKVKYSLESGDKPIHARSSSLEYLKKAISFFMPYQSASWCNGQGNPTKHSMHRELIDKIKKCEVRGDGAPTRAKRALTIAEFYKELEMLREIGVKTKNWIFAVKYPAMTMWQYHLIARIDDVCHFGTSNPMGNPTFPFALKTRVQWSKNVRTEQECPAQILLGSGDR